jgi:hypothetical protein
VAQEVMKGDEAERRQLEAEIARVEAEIAALKMVRGPARTSLTRKATR